MLSWTFAVCSPASGTSPSPSGTPAGHRVAEYPPPVLPSGAADYDGIWLVPADGATTNVCRASARQLRYPVPCPGLLPYGATVCATVCIDEGRFLLSSAFPGPSDYIGPNGTTGSGTLAIYGYPGVSPNYDCEKVLTETPVYIHGITQTLVQCSDAALVQWSEGPYTYVVRIAGRDTRNMAIAKLVAGSVTLIGP